MQVLYDVIPCALIKSVSGKRYHPECEAVYWSVVIYVEKHLRTMYCANAPASASMKGIKSRVAL